MGSVWDLKLVLENFWKRLTALLLKRIFLNETIFLCFDAIYSRKMGVDRPFDPI